MSFKTASSYQGDICVTSSDSVDLLHCWTRMQQWYHKRLAASSSGIANSDYIVNLWHFCNKLHKSCRQFQNNWPFFFFQRGPVVNIFLVFFCSSSIKSNTCSLSHYSFMLLQKHCLLIFREKKKKKRKEKKPGFFFFFCPRTSMFL